MKKFLYLLFLIPLWFVAYLNLPKLSKIITYDILRVKEDSHLGDSLEFFFYDVPKILLLLVGIIFVMGIVHSFFTHGRVRRLLLGKGEGWGILFASLLGSVTPFCSCSAVPLFIGFVTARIPLSVTFTFLVTAPMIHEVAFFLLWDKFGWQVAFLYLFTGNMIGMIAGYTIGKLRLEKWIEPFVFQSEEGKDLYDAKLTWEDRIMWGVDSVKVIVGKVWPWVILGIAVGAFIHGYVPQEILASVMGRDSWWSVPLAVLMGVPMYGNAAGVVPVMEALTGKGAALGTTLAFMMAMVGLSLPEAIILRRVLKPQLLFVFFGIVTVGIIFVGYLFNIVL